MTDYEKGYADGYRAMKYGLPKTPAEITNPTEYASGWYDGAELYKELSQPVGLKIALTGRMRTGKDQVADFLIKEYKFNRFAFGDGIREITRELYPEQYGIGKKPRQLLQKFGQMARQFNEDVWVNYTFRAMDYLLEEEPEANIVVTDLRQPNEYKRLLDRGFVIVRVISDIEVRIDRMKRNGDNFRLEDVDHETESFIDGFQVHYELTNNGTRKELEDKVIKGLVPEVIHIQKGV